MKHTLLGVVLTCSILAGCGGDNRVSSFEALFEQITGNVLSVNCSEVINSNNYKNENVIDIGRSCDIDITDSTRILGKDVSQTVDPNNIPKDAKIKIILETPVDVDELTKASHPAKEIQLLN
ncbi:hypothetical protein ACFFSY_12610 [Paenibacillus aurantiacus]|uniref:DUF4333 domain-containing protein n=1 Tax=Paenibacillus aurantiacus TaxID=1936118 RepID=A0ABV5KNG1_9BACL